MVGHESGGWAADCDDSAYEEVDGIIVKPYPVIEYTEAVVREIATHGYRDDA